ncbi:MAG: hypothetical protein QMD53_01630 [Actinomycetota bacterium]|nr:hypothetical protein [Actinomycetota bacterium]
MPKTRPGRISIISILFFLLSMVVLFSMVSMGERGGAGFFDNLYLTIPFLFAALFGLVAFFAGTFSMIYKGERAVLVVISTGIGLFVLIFLLGEIIFPH